MNITRPLAFYIIKIIHLQYKHYGYDFVLPFYDITCRCIDNYLLVNTNNETIDDT